MLIKSADDRSEDIVELNALLAQPGLTPLQKKSIKEELYNLKKGAWGEQQAAYYLDFHFAGYKNTIILHDLRLVLSNGKVAQIDHLIIDRFLDVYVLESKNWKQLTVDETGGCTIWDGRIIGVPSPLEQSRRHVEVLKRTFQIDPTLKTLAARQNIMSRVLMGPGCNLKAPHHKDLYIRADAFHTAWNKNLDEEPILSAALSLTRMVSRETLTKIGQTLVELHNPGRRDWRTKFGISPAPVIETMQVNKVVASIVGLADFVPSWGKDWFVLQGKPTEETKKAIRAAGYRAAKEKEDWVWRLKA